jgi:hypothetical protein
MEVSGAGRKPSMRWIFHARSEKSPFGKHYVHWNVVLLVGHPGEDLAVESESNRGEGALDEKAVEVAAAVAEAKAAFVETQAENENDVDRAVDRLVGEFRRSRWWLLKAEGEGTEVARVGMDMELVVTRIGPRYEDLLALGSQASDERPSVDLMTEGQAREYPFRLANLR